MKKNWNESVFGHVRATVRGRVPEAFINRCVRESIPIWDIKRLDSTMIACSFSVKDIKRIKPILKQTDCRIHFTRRSGLPFMISRLLSRSGIIVGLLLFLMVLFLLSNMVWKIDVVGADSQVEHQIRSYLKKMNVHVGSIEFFLPSLEKIEGDLSAELKKATWVGVSKDGTTYHIEIVQKELPEKESETGPQDLIAKKEATIREIYVEKGQAAVGADQVVEPGDLLISGSIGNENDPKFIAAKGEVLGETWYHSTVTVPLNTTYTTFTGKTYKRHMLTLFGWHLPIWGFESKPYKQANKEVVVKPFHFLLWKLPISYEKIIYREEVQAHRDLNAGEALMLGKDTARNQLLQKLSDDAKVLTENIRKQVVKDGELHLEILYTVEEEISKPRSIIPNDRMRELEKKNQKKSTP